MSDDVFQEVERHEVTRRSFLGGAAKLSGAALLTIPSIAAACGGVGVKSGANARKVTLRWGSIYTTGSITLQMEQWFGDRVKQLTNGAVDFQIFANGALGKEEDIYAQAQQNTIQAMTSGAPGIGSQVPQLPVLELPYTFTSIQQLHDVQTKLFDDIDKLVSAHGFRLLGTFIDGPREVISFKPLRTPDDFRGTKMRVPTTPVYVGLARALNANPTPTPFNEVYTDLQTHLVDLAEGSLDTFTSKKWYEAAKNVSITHHIITPAYMIINKTWLESLDKDTQKAVLQAGRDASNKDVKDLGAYNDDQIKTLKSGGVNVLDVDINAFKEKLAPFDDDYAKKQGDAVYSFYQKAKKLAKG